MHTTIIPDSWASSICDLRACNWDQSAYSVSTISCKRNWGTSQAEAYKHRPGLLELTSRGFSPPSAFSLHYYDSSFFGSECSPFTNGLIFFKFPRWNFGNCISNDLRLKSSWEGLQRQVGWHSLYLQGRQGGQGTKSSYTVLPWWIPRIGLFSGDWSLVFLKIWHFLSSPEKGHNEGNTGSALGLRLVYDVYRFQVCLTLNDCTL